MAYTNEEIKAINFNAHNTVARFEGQNGEWATIHVIDSEVPYILNGGGFPEKYFFDHTVTPDFCKWYKTLTGAKKYLKKYGLAEVA